MSCPTVDQWSLDWSASLVLSFPMTIFVSSTTRCLLYVNLHFFHEDKRTKRISSYSPHTANNKELLKALTPWRRKSVSERRKSSWQISSCAFLSISLARVPIILCTHHRYCGLLLLLVIVWLMLQDNIMFPVPGSRVVKISIVPV